MAITVSSSGGRDRAPYDSARRPHPFVEEALDLLRYRDLLWQWTARTITLRYKRSVLGIVWTLIEPLMLMAILTVVFSAIFRFSLPRYPIYVLCGLLLFDFLSRSTSQMSEEIVATHSLAQRIYLPRSAFAVAAVLAYLFNWVIALLPLALIMLALGHPFSPALLTLPIGMLLTALFALGVGLLVCSVSAFFPDAKLIYSVLLTAWLYATPIIYPTEIVPVSWVPVLKLNPLFHLVQLVRDPPYYGRVAPASAWWIGAVSSIVCVLLGWWLFSRSRDAYNYHL